MPDESCRSCGGNLVDYSKCIKCSKTTKMICVSCNNQTLEQFHSFCVDVKVLTSSVMINNYADYFLATVA